MKHIYVLITSLFILVATPAFAYEDNVEHLTFLPELLGQNIDSTLNRLEGEGYFYKKGIAQNGDTVEWRTEEASILLGWSLNEFFELAVLHPANIITSLTLKSSGFIEDLYEYGKFQTKVEGYFSEKFGEPLLEYNDLHDNDDAELRALVKKITEEIPTWLTYWQTESTIIILKSHMDTQSMEILILPCT